MSISKESTIIITYALLLINLSACANEEFIVKLTKIHLQEATVTGPINQSPVHLSEKSEKNFLFTISPRFSYNPTKQINASVSGHTPVNSEGIFGVDTLFNNEGYVSYYQVPGANIYEYEEQNLTWNMASFSAGLDFDARFTKSFAAFAGFNFSSSDNQSVWGGNAGLAVLLTTDKLGLRLDAGVHVQSIAYDAYTVQIVETAYTDTEYVVFYHDIAKTTHWNPFFSLTINSASQKAFVNFFLNVGYSWQTLVGFTPQDKDETMYYDNHQFFGFYWYDEYKEVVQDLRGTATASYLNITPGLFFRLGGSSRILVGVRLFFDNGLDDTMKSTFILPMLQADFMF